LVGVSESTACRWYAKSGLPIDPKPKRIKRAYLRSIAHLRPCMNCHAKLRVLVKHSARYIGVDAGIVRDYRKKMGLWRPTATEANKAVAIQLGRAKREQWGTAKAALRTRYIGPDSSAEQHLAHYWREETLAVRALERQCSWSKHPEAKRGPMDYYWANVEQCRKNSKESAMRRYYRMKHNPEFKLRHIMRNTISRICRKTKTGKSRKTNEYLGCTFAEARRHIERQFRQGMTWENHGQWEVHHIIPLAEWDLSDPQQMVRATHFTNLKPLWRIENRSIGARMIGEHQMALL
jgi:hypothetical protein